MVYYTYSACSIITAILLSQNEKEETTIKLQGKKLFKTPIKRYLYPF
jgi:hypothetical protein